MKTKLLQTRSCRSSLRQGAAAVEFAFVAPFLFMVLIGVAEMGRAMMIQHAITMAAREGGRESVLPGATTSSVQAVVSQYLSASGLGVQTATTTLSKDPATAQSRELLTVTVSLPYSAVSLLGSQWFPSSMKLSSRVSMRKEGID